MEHIWAPWRLDYVVAEKPDNCILCQKRDVPDDDIANHVLYRGSHSYVLLNAFPYNSGHVMVVPYRHLDNLTGLNAEEASEIMLIAQWCVQALQEALGAEGINLGMNIGQPAGAGIEDHIHLHIVPRWSGDTNYMTTVANTRVVPQALEESAEQLRALIQRIAENSQ